MLDVVTNNMEQLTQPGPRNDVVSYDGAAPNMWSIFLLHVKQLLLWHLWIFGLNETKQWDSTAYGIFLC